MLLPAVSKLSSIKKDKEVQSLVYDTEKYISMICIPIVAMTVVWSSEIIEVFLSREFLPASTILKLLWYHQALTPSTTHISQGTSIRHALIKKSKMFSQQLTISLFLKGDTTCHLRWEAP